MSPYYLEFINLNNPRYVKEVQDFLRGFDLTYSASEVEFTLALRDGDDIIATGSFNGSTIRNVAVDPTRQGEGLTAQIISELIQELARRGRFHYFLYTKPDKAWLFADLGLKEIVRGQHAALLEGGIGTLNQYLQNVKLLTAALPQPRAALVMNCNPFTLGHRYLIEKASRENAGVIVFVVSEDSSSFPFSDRLALVKAGTHDLANVAVVETGPYQVSAATFPTYFTKGEQQQQAPTELDVRLFGEKIAPTLGITVRYVGDEPYCPVTSGYNDTMLQLLPPMGINVNVVHRKEMAGRAISASTVRECIRRGDWQTLETLLPKTTFNYLTDPTHADIIKKLQNNSGRH
jgi:[citrate (pro-3S)-lyase] ligase